MPVITISFNYKLTIIINYITINFRVIDFIFHFEYCHQKTLLLNYLYLFIQL